MSAEAPPRDLKHKLLALPNTLGEYLHSIPNDHPLQIALRTYALSISLSLGPALVPFLTSERARRSGLTRLGKILGRELGVTGFAFAMTAGVGGGAVLRDVFDLLAEQGSPGTDEGDSICGPARAKAVGWLASLKESHRTFLANVLSAAMAMTLFHCRRPPPASAKASIAIPFTPPLSPSSSSKPTPFAGRPSITLDLTLLLLVRAMDALAQVTIQKGCEVIEKNDSVHGKEAAMRRRRLLSMRLDALVFWASSARIMWCFFYQPERLPRSYNKWIMTVANIDPRILAAMRALRSGTWSYRRHHSVQPDLLSSLSQDLGYPAAWGDITRLPARGGPDATAVWKELGVKGRDGIGGTPCELVHANASGGSCSKNTALRGTQAFASAMAIYLPVHFLPILLTRPRTLLRPSKLMQTLLAVLRSASFLSTFVSCIWAAVCLTRTVLLARLFPRISHDVWDGPFGCTFAGSLVCGGSIWIEQGRRRGEMALYVLPRAIRACLPERWVRSGAQGVQWGERLAFVLSLSTILTAAIHRPDSLRGLSRWTLAFIMKGPNAGFWRRKRRGESVPPTPVETTPAVDTQPRPYTL
ncbi:uncharacterized protein B0H18DRAFT_971843 [Fomitopsis serialis]|uniref:uncharacterized protein n=1 Tax=Fomitopsis serialis TaxID=139415 RepID=UPI0020084A85|nr:uncharacterized protein B0H18DRAFT_971843 [Neoantrodia serialis]KAH9937698.1 hypothetical protein B0H18DRAFT_971843 [Neoantrodia serialis]